MQKLLTGLLLLLTFQSYAQRANLTQKVFSCNFADEDKIYWPARNNSGFNFAIENGAYTIECLDDSKKAYAPLKWENSLENYKLETNVRLEKGTSGIFGLAFGIQGKLEGGYILELDKKGSFRVISIGPAGQVPLSGDKKNSGWLIPKTLNKPGKYNKLGIEQQDGKVSVFINNETAFSFHNKLPRLSGGFGFFLEGRAGAVADDFVIYGPEELKPDSISIKAIQAQKLQRLHDSIPSLQAKKNVKAKIPAPAKDSVKTAAKAVKQLKKSPVSEAKKPELSTQNPPTQTVKTDSSKAKVKPAPKDKIKPAEIPKATENTALKPLPDSSKDIATLGLALGESRKKAQKLKSENDNLAAELKQVKIKNEELQAFINKNLDVKLKTDLEQQKNKNESLQKENDNLKEENSSLKTLKENIAAAKDGDIIILLSDNLRKEQKKSEELAKKLKELEEKMKNFPVPSRPQTPPVKPKPKQVPVVPSKQDSSSTKIPVKPKPVPKVPVKDK